VVNIQKFSKESIAKQSDYAVNVQRIYFLDEAHRSYKPTGSFLANLLSSDREAVMIALTGTPPIGRFTMMTESRLQAKNMIPSLCSVIISTNITTIALLLMDILSS